MKISPQTFIGRRILVVGDVMLDRYIHGHVSRISPEAPVPVLSVTGRTHSPGGAANVAANLAGLGCSVALWAVTGSDEEGKILSSLTENSLVETFFQIESSRPTTTKTRIVAENRQLVRCDEESTAPLSQITEDTLLASLKPHLAGADGLILSDYDKGLFKGGLSRQIIDLAHRAGIPIYADPKGTDWERYRGADWVTPNEKELTALKNPEDERDLPSVAHALRKSFAIAKLLVTMGSRGMALFDEGRYHAIPAPKVREVYDVSGAGDTVIALLAAALASGFSEEEALELANTAAGVVITRAGTVPVTVEDLISVAKAGLGSKVFTPDEASAMAKLWRRRGETLVFTNGCFDLLHPGHISLLRRAAEEGDRLIVGLNSDQSVKKLKGPNRPALNQDDRAALLSALQYVDMVVIFSEETPLALIESLVPHVLVKGGDYAPETVVGRKFVEDRGGRVVIVPLLEGRSTTSIIESLR